MAKFFSIRQLRSVCRNVLFIVFLEFTIVNKCASNQDVCIKNNRRSISYIQADIAESTWFAARQKCINLTSTLPVLCDKGDEDALKSFLNARRINTSVWTSGKKIDFTEWTWIDGQPFNKTGITSLESGIYFHVALSGDQHYSAQDSQHPNSYLCQYSGSSCNSEDVRLANGRCIRPSDDHRTWFDARNMCLINGGDLAIINGDDLVKLRESNMLVYNRWYWIGLRKNAWYWSGNKTASGSGEEIKHTNWFNDRSSLNGDCISIDASNGGWKAVRCTDTEIVVCQSDTVETTSAKMPSSTITVSRMSSSTTNKPTLRPSTSNTMLRTTTREVSNRSTLESAANNTTNAESNVLLYSGVGAGIIVLIIICIIVAILVVRYKRKSNKDMNQSKIKNYSEQNRLELPPSKPASASASPLTNGQVAGADDSLGVYAEISPATLNQPEPKSNIEHPGIVYASLDFQKEPTSLETDTKSAHATENPAIYAN